jgi:Ni/Fe-hydrogenase subunit HybB-like protein
MLFGFTGFADPIWYWLAPVISGGFLAITGALLLWDLEHPARFYLIFAKPQWKSWLVRGAFIILAYSIVLALHFLASVFIVTSAGPDDRPFTRSMILWSFFQFCLALLGLPLSIMTAVYTAYLFAQAKARDLWQKPLLPPHLLVQALLLGSAVLLPFALWLQHGQTFASPVHPLLWILAVTSVVHILMVWGETSLTHATAHSRLAVWEMIYGRYRYYFWIGLVMSILGGLLPWLVLYKSLSFANSSPGPAIVVGVAGAPFALIGLLLYEHAYVQAGQSVPLA